MSAHITYSPGASVWLLDKISNFEWEATVDQRGTDEDGMVWVWADCHLSKVNPETLRPRVPEETT